MTTNVASVALHCAYCGYPVSPGGEVPPRFGEPFCSDAQAEQFAAGVRAARMESAARDQGLVVAEAAGETCAPMPSGQRSWRDSLKRALCWGAPLLVLVAIPLLWAGGWAAAGGSLLTGLALLACPLGMYFMMRSMMKTHEGAGSAAERPREDRHA